MKNNYKNSTQVFYSPLHCMACGTVLWIPRFKSSRREFAHVKTMFCYKCKCECDFIETEKGSAEEYLFSLEYIEHQKYKKAVSL